VVALLAARVSDSYNPRRLLSAPPLSQNQIAPVRGQWRAGLLLLGIVLVINLIFMPARLCPGDATAWWQESRDLLRYGRLWVDPDFARTVGEPGQFFVLNPTDGRWYSKYGIANSLMAIPPLELDDLLRQGGPSSAARLLVIYNIWNILLSLALAGVLYVITGRYCDIPWRRITYVLACLFATFLWYYQRAQGCEIWQTLFFALLYECLLRSLRPAEAAGRWLLLAWLFTGLLVLSRILFGILIPAIIFLVILSLMIRRQRWLRILPMLLIPPCVILALLACVNDIKFGSPWLSGYHQWRPEQHVPNGSWLDGVYGLLLSGHWSIFIYFPLLLPAIGGLKRFAAQYWLDTIVIFTIFLTTLFVLGKIPSWRGEWTYGPRYMLFLLPILALPALNIAAATSSCRAWLPLSLTAALLCFSLWLQFEVNRADFWFLYYLQQPLQGRMNSDLSEYIYDHHEGIIFHDLWSHRQDMDHSEFFTNLKDVLTPQDLTAYRQRASQIIARTNFYWWPPDQAQ
jgi:hypothetical protein